MRLKMENDRCGYNVTEKLYKIWEIELELMEELLKVCSENDIKVFAFAGTLLGAIRHKGFIPWDDDMDVAMLREDFEKLCSLDNKFKRPFFLQHATNDRRYFVDYARLRNSETTGIITWNSSLEYNNGIYIDIFVLDGIPDNKVLLKGQYFVKRLLRNIIREYYGYDNVSDVSLSLPQKVKKSIFHHIGKMCSYEKWINIYNSNLSRYMHSATKVGLITHEERFMKKYWCFKEDLNNIVYVDFENIKIPVPSSFDSILHNMYGEYMYFPPEEERGAWHEDMIIFDPDISYTEYLKKRE